MDDLRKRIQIGVIGPSTANLPKNLVQRKRMLESAEALGSLLAQKGAVLFTGGCDGVMEYAAKGAKSQGGTTVGTPGNRRRKANKYTDVEIVTNTDTGAFVVAGMMSCDVLIVMPGGAGTLSEFAMAYRNGKKCIIMKGFDKSYDSLVGKYLDNVKTVLIRGANTPESAVAQALSS